MDWDALVHRSGGALQAPRDDDALRRVEKAVQGLNGTASDAEIENALLLAASNGQLRERLTDAQTRDAQATATLRSQSASGKSDPVFTGTTLLVNLLAIIVLAVGPILVFPSVRTNNDFLIYDLSTAAVTSGILMMIAAVWFSTMELVLTPWGGTRRGIYGPRFFILPLVLSGLAIASTLYRIGQQGAFGAVPIGVALQFIALALYVLAAVFALRNRGEAATLKADAAVKAPGIKLSRQANRLRKDISWALGKAPATEIDRGAALAGLRSLYESGKLPADRVETILRSIA